MGQNLNVPSTDFTILSSLTVVGDFGTDVVVVVVIVAELTTEAFGFPEFNVEGIVWALDRLSGPNLSTSLSETIS